MEDTIKLIIVDDHALYRIGERSVIEEKLPQVEILADYGSGEELLVHLEKSVHPDIILLDIIMPGIGGIEVAKTLKVEYPNIKIIMLSSEVAPEVVGKLLDIGVNGYLSKLAVKEDLVDAIKSVVEDNIFYGRDIIHIIYDLYIKKSSEINNKSFFKRFKNSKVTITNREKEIIELYCEGLSLKEISIKLSVSKRTIDNHKANIMGKLGFKSNVELVKFAIREGLVCL